MRYVHTQRTRGVPLDIINALRVILFPALRLVGHQQECMNNIQCAMSVDGTNQLLSKIQINFTTQTRL